MPLKNFSYLIILNFLIFSAVIGLNENSSLAMEFSVISATPEKTTNTSSFLSSVNFDENLKRIVNPSYIMDLAVVEGELKKFHKLTFTWDGTSAVESEMTFRDNRLNVTFTSPTGKTYKVPGYFAADGNAGETSADCRKFG